MIEELHKFDRYMYIYVWPNRIWLRTYHQFPCSVIAVSANVFVKLSMLCYKTFFDERQNCFSKFVVVVLKWYSRSINEWDLLICNTYIHGTLFIYSIWCVFVCVFSTMCNDIYNQNCETYICEAWFMSHFKLVFRWFWLIYRSFSVYMWCLCVMYVYHKEPRTYLKQMFSFPIAI